MGKYTGTNNIPVTKQKLEPYHQVEVNLSERQQQKYQTEFIIYWATFPVQIWRLPRTVVEIEVTHCRLICALVIYEIFFDISLLGKTSNKEQNVTVYLLQPRFEISQN